MTNDRLCEEYCDPVIARREARPTKQSRLVAQVGIELRLLQRLESILLVVSVDAASQ